MAKTQTSDREPIMAWVDKRDRDRLAEIAREHDRSLSAEIRKAVREHVEREDLSPDRWLRQAAREAKW